MPDKLPEKRPPTADFATGGRVLSGLVRQRSPLAALEVMQQELGDTFQITLPAFDPVVLVGPAANRALLVDERDHFCWRSESDPVTHLLRRGLLVVDGAEHAGLRACLAPALNRPQVNRQVATFCHYTDQITANWQDGRAYNMLIEMRRLALLILMDSLFGVDFRPHLAALWPAIIRTLAYISPGAWLVWPNLPRPGYRRAIRQVDQFLYRIIAERRKQVKAQEPIQPADDLMTRLVKTAGLDDGLIRDQLLTMLIAGHDTSTALLAWVLYLLGRHPAVLAQARQEVDEVLGDGEPQLEQIGRLTYLEQVIKETLRLYPPIHIGSRRVGGEAAINGYQLPAGGRVMYSIYLSHRHPDYWSEPAAFRPERFAERSGEKPPAFTYLPFGGGPRNCIGAAFAQVEAKVVLARLLQTVDLRLVRDKVRPYMGATLEPRPAVWLEVKQRRERAR